MQIHTLTPNEPATWPATLTQPATFTVLDSWTGISNRIYGFHTYRLEARDENNVTGILSLVEIKHPLLGHYLTTAPFGSYGGFAYADTHSRDLLLDSARQLATTLGVDYANLRFLAEDPTPPPGWVQNPIYCTYLLDISHPLPSLLSNFSSDHRNHIRKSLKKGFDVKFGHLDLLDDAYEGLALSMHELGSPYHSKTYLRTMAQALGNTLEFAVLYDPNGKIAGAGVFIAHGTTLTNLHANILHRVRSDYAGEFLYWKIIERASQRGFETFDIGRSLNGSGNETFKMKWKPHRAPLAYWYALKPGSQLPHLNQKSPKFQAAIWLWKRLPAFLVRAAGPYLICGLA